MKKRILACIMTGLMTALMIPTTLMPVAAKEADVNLNVSLSSKAYNKDDKIEKSTGISPAVNWTKGLEDLALQIVFTVSGMDETKPLFREGDGQLELSSSGGPDKNEIYYSPRNLTLTNGKNEILIPLSSFTNNGGALDQTNINFFRMYAWFDQAVTFSIDSAKLVDISERLRFSSVYGDNMVLQQNKPIVITGTAVAGHTIKLTMGDETQTTTADSEGNWEVTFAARKGGYTKYTINAYDDGTLSETLENVVIGEVWLTAGQSNMDFRLKTDADGYKIIYGDDPDEFVRSLELPKYPSGGNGANYPADPQSEIAGAYWANGDDPAAIGETTAVGYFCAVKLREELDVPVGIINSGLGSTNAYTWLSREAIDGNAEMKAYIQKSGRYITKENFNKWGSENFNQMSAMYNYKIAPLENLSISGLLWYQGESNVGDELGSYSRFLALLQESYGEFFGFKNDSMPLIYCHITSLMYQEFPLGFDRLGYYSEDFNKAWQAHQNTMAQVTTYDQPQDYDYTPFIQEGGSAACHTIYKQGIGTRMGYAALKLAYNKDTEYTSPVMTGYQVADGKIWVTFDHVGDGLAAKAPNYTEYTANASDTELRGFAIRGADGVYVPAKAKIINKNTVEIWNDTVKDPVAATYAFTQMSQNANLVSTQDGEEMFAAVPFRTNTEETGVSYYRAHDWTYCDIPFLWYYETNIVAHKTALWAANNGATLTYDAANKTSGNASLKVSFDGSAVVSPTISKDNNPYPDTDTNYNKFGSVSIDVKNTGSQAVKVEELRFITKSGIVYRPTLIGTNAFGTTVEAGGWTTLTFDLNKLAKNDDVSNLMANNLTSITQIEIELSAANATQTNVVNIDNIMFGMAGSGAGSDDSDDQQPDTAEGILEDFNGENPWGRTPVDENNMAGVNGGAVDPGGITVLPESWDISAYKDGTYAFKLRVYASNDMTFPTSGDADWAFVFGQDLDGSENNNVDGMLRFAYGKKYYLSKGWNEIHLPISSGFVANGGDGNWNDLTKITHVRVYDTGSGAGTIYLDEISLVKHTVPQPEYDAVNRVLQLDAADNIAPYYDGRAMYVSNIKKEGTAAAFTFAGHNWIKRAYDPTDAHVSMEDGAVKFWLYVNDPNQIGSMWFEMKDADDTKLNYSKDKFGTLVAGWNEVTLKLSDGSVNGGSAAGFDTTKIVFSHLEVEGPNRAQKLLVGIDDMRIVNLNGPCPHENTEEIANSAVAAICNKAGKKADQKCSACGTVIKGAAIPATGIHNYVDGKCDDCGESMPTSGRHNYVNGKCTDCGALYETVMRSGDKLYYVKDGKVTKYNGLKTMSDGVKYLFTNGVVRTDFTGIHEHAGKFYYIVEGKFSAYNGLKTIGSAKYLLKYGIVRTDFTGIHEHAGKFYYIVEGKFSTYNGLKTIGSAKYLLTNGIVRADFNGLHTHAGLQYYIVEGKFVAHNGLKTIDGVKYVLNKGILNTSVTGFYNHAGTSYYVVKGVALTGLKEIDGVKKLFKDGLVNTAFTGYYKHGIKEFYLIKGIAANGVVTVDGRKCTFKNGVLVG